MHVCQSTMYVVHISSIDLLSTTCSMTRAKDSISTVVLNSINPSISLSTAKRTHTLNEYILINDRSHSSRCRIERKSANAPAAAIRSDHQPSTPYSVHPAPPVGGFLRESAAEESRMHPSISSHRVHTWPTPFDGNNEPPSGGAGGGAGAGGAGEPHRIPAVNVIPLIPARRVQYSRYLCDLGVLQSWFDDAWDAMGVQGTGTNKLELFASWLAPMIVFAGRWRMGWDTCL